MRLFFIACLCCIQLIVHAQVDVKAEEVFKIVEEMPRFPGCENQQLAPDDLSNCAQSKMLEFIYQNINYPQQAIADTIEGTVVVQFVVTEAGRIEESKIVREIGGGCGAEAMRVVEMMNDLPEPWLPGKQAGNPVKVLFTLPVKYQLDKSEPEPPKDYFMVGKDSVYTVLDVLPQYGDSPDALTQYLLDVPYPTGVDSCVAGAMVAQLFIGKNGELRISEIYDYSNLGFDYQFEAIKMLNATAGKWSSAMREEKPVISYLPVRIVFKPANPECQSVAESYEAAYTQAIEGEGLYAEGKVNEAIVKWDAALELMPDNAEFLLLRGQALLETNEQEKACVDLNLAKKNVPLAAWLDQAMGIICVEKE